MKILITGGAGFIGSNFIHFLLENDPSIEIINFDKLTYAGNLDNLKDLEGNPRYRFVQADIGDPRALDKVCPGIELMVNFAAESHVDRSIMDPTAFLTTGVMGMYELLEALRRHHIPRMIHISTDEVFGDVPGGEADEESPLNPSSPYSAAKAASELLARSYVRTHGTPVITTRFSNVYGPYQYPEKIIPLFITNLLENKKVPMYGDGKQVREWIFVEDVCRGLWLVMKEGVVGESYNMGSRTLIANSDTTAKLLAYAGKDETSIEHVPDRPGHDRRYALNSDKMTRVFGWKAEVSFDDGLRRTFDWYRDHAWWWEKIKSGEYQKYYAQQYRALI